MSNPSNIVIKCDQSLFHFLCLISRLRFGVSTTETALCQVFKGLPGVANGGTRQRKQKKTERNLPKVEEILAQKIWMLQFLLNLSISFQRFGFDQQKSADFIHRYEDFSNQTWRRIERLSRHGDVTQKAGDFAKRSLDKHISQERIGDSSGKKNLEIEVFPSCFTHKHWAETTFNWHFSPAEIEIRCKIWDIIIPFHLQGP